MRQYKSTGYKRRAYEDFARIIGERLQADGQDAGRYNAILWTGIAIADLFAADNPLFDRERFNARITEWREGKRS